MHRNRHFFAIRVFSGQKNQYVCKCRFVQNKLARTLCTFMLSYQIYVHLENGRTFQPQIIDDFPAVWSYGKLSSKFLVSSVKVIDTVGFLSFF